MKSDILKEHQYLLLQMLKSTLFEHSRDFSIDKSMLPMLFSEANIQTVDLLVFSSENLEAFDLSFACSVRNKINSLFMRNISVNNAHIRLHNMFQKENIPYVILKGMAAADYYPDPLMRAMGDVDFLIKPEDIDRVDNLFSSLGYTSRKKENDHHITYDGPDVRYELHFSPAGIPNGLAGERIEEMFSDIISERLEIKTELGNIFVPSQFHHGLILLLHTVHHLTGDGLGLRHLCDWAVFLNSFDEAAFNSLFENRLKSVGLWQFTLVLSNVCSRYLGAQFCPCFDSEISQLADRFITDVFSAGNFGQKNENRSHESLFISSPADKNNIRHSSILLQAIRSVNEIVCRNWPFVRKYKIFLPIGWIFFGGRYVFRSLIGKRPAIHLKSVYNEAQTRIEFYDKLIIFDIDEE